MLAQLAWLVLVVLFFLRCLLFLLNPSLVCLLLHLLLALLINFACLLALQLLSRGISSAKPYKSQKTYENQLHPKGVS